MRSIGDRRRNAVVIAVTAAYVMHYVAEELLLTTSPPDMHNVVGQSLRAIALVAITGSVASAQPWAGSFTKAASPASVSYSGYGVGPYDGNLLLTVPAPANVLADITTANSGFSFWCVDGAGVFGNDTGVKVFTIASIGDVARRTQLAKAAFVTTIFNSSAVSGGAAVSNFNAAIWSIMGASPASFTPGNAGTVATYVADAEAGYNTLDLNSFYYVQFDDNNLYVQGGKQELIFQGNGEPFIVPEPGSFALMAGGLLLLAGVRRRRSQR